MIVDNRDVKTGRFTSAETRNGAAAVGGYATDIALSTYVNAFFGNVGGVIGDAAEHETLPAQLRVQITTAAWARGAIRKWK